MPRLLITTILPASVFLLFHQGKNQHPILFCIKKHDVFESQNALSSKLFPCNVDYQERIQRAAKGEYCSSTSLTDILRQEIVNRHNELRSTLAKGKVSTKAGTYAPSGKNMYKLSYDCGLEAQAQEWANQCSYTHSNGSARKASENLYWAWGDDISATSHISKAIKMWWDELVNYETSDPQNRLTLQVFNAGIGHFTAMAWGSSTTVGCGFTNCPFHGLKSAYVVCRYQATGNLLNYPIYEFGRPCTADFECTTFLNSMCSSAEGLCYL